MKNAHILEPKRRLQESSKHRSLCKGLVSTLVRSTRTAALFVLLYIVTVTLKSTGETVLTPYAHVSSIYSLCVCLCSCVCGCTCVRRPEDKLEILGAILGIGLAFDVLYKWTLSGLELTEKPRLDGQKTMDIHPPASISSMLRLQTHGTTPTF